MSARQAKRLNQLAAANENEESEDEDVEFEQEQVAKSAGFAFLADSDSDSEESDREEDDVVVVKRPSSDVDAEQEEDESPQVQEPTTSKKSKKNKKKKGKKGKKPADTGDEEEKAPAVEQNVDEILGELLAADTAAGLRIGGDGDTKSARDQYENALLSVDLKVINADKEMKRIFGVKDGASGRKRTDPRNAARLTTKKVRLVTPLDEWPRPPTFVGGGIRWTRANKPAGPSWNSFCNYFEVTWSIAYKKSQEEFEVLQQTHDPNLIGHFLQRYPFHIDALLQMSEVFQHHGQMDHAADCIKRCMYVLELAWGDQFDVTKGNCRMDFHAEHNDGFLRALFLLMKQVGRRGCMRSAFETAKLLLALDPCGDPMNVLLAIDYYAVTSRQCQFLIDLAESKTEAVNRFAPKESDASSVNARGKRSHVAAAGADISALPNLQFAVALAHYFLDHEIEAREQLARALLRFPTVLKPLLEKIAANTSSGPWMAVLSSPIFANAKNVGGEGSVLQHLLNIYVMRNATVWKVNDVQAFLLQSAQYAVASSELAHVNSQVLELPSCLDKYMRAVANDYSDEITTLPADHPMMQPPQLPNGQPLDAAALADLARQAQEQMDANGNLPADANPLLLFLQTLLPWNHVQGAGAQPPPPPNDQ